MTTAVKPKDDESDSGLSSSSSKSEQTKKDAQVEPDMAYRGVAPGSRADRTLGGFGAAEETPSLSG